MNEKNKKLNYQIKNKTEQENHIKQEKKIDDFNVLIERKQDNYQ